MKRTQEVDCSENNELISENAVLKALDMDKESFLLFINGKQLIKIHDEPRNMVYYRLNDITLLVFQNLISCFEKKIKNIVGVRTNYSEPTIQMTG